MTPDDMEELQQLRKSAAMFMTSPIDKSFFHLECAMDSARLKRSDATMNVSAFLILGDALCELRRVMNEA